MDYKDNPPNPKNFGRYQLLDELGQGGMGRVYKAYDPLLERVVAIKFLLSGSTGQQGEIERFLREAKTTAQLRHPNIVAIHDIGVEQGQYFFTMEFIAGLSLKALIKKSTIAPLRGAALLKKIGSAIGYAHSMGVIHRDLKPDNVMIGEDNEPKVMDFGLAKIARASKKLSKSGMVMGTLQYMPPEQAEAHSQEIDERSDVYAMGAILYEILAGRPPFMGTSSYNLLWQILNDDPMPPSRLKHNVPQYLQNICLKALEKEKKRRYQSAAEFVADLDCFIEGKSVQARPRAFFHKIPRMLRRPSVWLSMILLVVVAILFTTIIFLLQQRAAPPSSFYMPDPRMSKVIGPFKKLQEVWAKTHDTAVLEQAYSLLDRLSCNAETLPYYYWLANAYEQSAQVENAWKLYQHCYVEVPDLHGRLPGLQGMVSCALRKKEFLPARKMVEELKDQVRQDTQWCYLAAKTFFHTGEWDRAKTFLDKVDPTQIAAQKADYELYGKWLKALTPVTHYPCKANYLQLVDLTGKGRQHIALGHDNMLNVHMIAQRRLRNLCKINVPTGQAFQDITTGKVIAGDERDLLILTAKQDNSLLSIWRKQGNNWTAVFSQNLQSRASKMWVGELYPDRRDVIVLAMGYYNRDTKILYYKEKNAKAGVIFDSIEIDPTLRGSHTDAISLDVGDADMDDHPEIILGTGRWSGFDLRVYGREQSSLFFVCRDRTAPMGAISACKIFDLNQDGRPEILVAKEYTRNTQVFGPDNPYGMPAGLYLFHYASGKLQKIWDYTLAPSPQSEIRLTGLCGGNIPYLGAVAALRYEANHYKDGSLNLRVISYLEGLTIKNDLGKDTQVNQEIWLVCHHDGNYHCLPFTRDKKIWGMEIGDVDGNHTAELLLLDEDGLWVYGLGQE